MGRLWTAEPLPSTPLALPTQTETLPPPDLSLVLVSRYLTMAATGIPAAAVEYPCASLAPYRTPPGTPSASPTPAGLTRTGRAGGERGTMIGRVGAQEERGTAKVPQSYREVLSPSQTEAPPEAP